MSGYAVIACPKCRKHAQIIEYDTARTTKCQNCGVVLRIKKLRVFYTSDSLDEAISARTHLQAQMHGKSQGAGKMQENTTGIHVLPSGSGGKLPTSGRDFVDKRKKPGSKKDARKIILDLLESAGGAMDAETLKAHALEQDVNGEKLGKTLNSLLQTGEIYSPKTGYIHIV